MARSSAKGSSAQAAGRGMMDTRGRRRPAGPVGFAAVAVDDGRRGEVGGSGSRRRGYQRGGGAGRGRRGGAQKWKSAGAGGSGRVRRSAGDVMWRAGEQAGCHGRSYEGNSRMKRREGTWGSGGARGEGHRRIGMRLLGRNGTPGAAPAGRRSSEVGRRRRWTSDRRIGLRRSGRRRGAGVNSRSQRGRELRGFWRRRR